MCIDHDKTVEVATANNGVPVYANTPPFSWAFNPDIKKYTYDVPGAKALIESSGLGARQRRPLCQGRQEALHNPLRPRRPAAAPVKFAQLARDQLKECGIEVKVSRGDLNTVLIPKVLDYPNDFDTYLGGWSTALDPDDYSIFHSTRSPRRT